MPSRPRHPLSRHLVVLAFAGVLPLVALTALGLARVYQQQRDVAQSRAMEVTRAIGIAVDSELQRSLAALKVVASARSGDLETFRASATRIVATQPNWRNLILSDPVGRVVMNTRVSPGEAPPPIIEMASHRVAVERALPVVGTLAKGRESHAFAVRAPVVDGGKVIYVVSAVVEPRTIVDIMARQSLPENWVISVFDHQGMRVARSRGHDRYIGQPASPSLQELIMSHGREGMGITTILEGPEAFTAYTTLPGGWVVSTGIDLDVVDDPARKTVGAYGVAVLASLLAGFLAVLFVVRRINEPMASLRDQAHLLGQGGRPQVPDTSIREISQVGDALVAAARERDAHDRAKDEFLVLLGHELRNPLAALANASTLLQHSADDRAIAERAAGVVQRQVGHLARLTDDLLDVASAMMGKLALGREPVDLARIARDVLAAQAASGRTSAQRIEADLREAPVHGDPVRLGQILTNLVVNAAKFTPPGGTIRVRTFLEGGTAVMEVADDGAGMNAELAARAFDLFVQGEPAGDRAAGGLGIGLTLVRRLAELHGGSAQVHSAGEGQGSTFVVRLPSSP